MSKARREAEELLSQFPILYPNDALVRTALRAELLSEDFENGRLYGTVRVVDPFA